MTLSKYTFSLLTISFFASNFTNCCLCIKKKVPIEEGGIEIRTDEDSILGQYAIVSEEKTDQTNNSHQVQPNSEGIYPCK